MGVRKEELGNDYRFQRGRERSQRLHIQHGLEEAACGVCQLFLEETWSHGDVSIEITGAKAMKRSTDDSVNLVLIDGEGNEMVFYGFTNDYVDMIAYKGEIYAGPYTG